MPSSVAPEDHSRSAQPPQQRLQTIASIPHPDPLSGNHFPENALKASIPGDNTRLVHQLPEVSHAGQTFD